jgi:hypothetical protein
MMLNGIYEVEFLANEFAQTDFVTREALREMFSPVLDLANP